MAGGGFSKPGGRLIVRSGAGSEAFCGCPVVGHDELAVDVVPLGHRLGGVAELVHGGFGVEDLVDLGRHCPSERVGRDALGATARDLEEVGHLAAMGGEPGHHGWPLVNHIDYTNWQGPTPAVVRHPHDSGVWLSSATALDDLPVGVNAVVSLCLVGRTQVPKGIDQVGFRLIDVTDPASNPNLDFVIRDAAETVAALRAEGKTVLVHCVAAQSRTPTVGVAYAMLRGVEHDRALAEVCDALPAANPNRTFRAALKRLADKGIQD